ncbi:OmpA family outer membrane protein [Flaviramulus aquimarinus]|uniref:OmpA family outer membrane protein n=1 Tax=Flaviramulus aquimarinus TaxID=1170456 RepID=A0ABP9F7U6_9FLAO
MKNLILLLTILSVSLINAQAFIGKGDNKFQVGANIQDNGTGLNVSYDFGIGENISIGISSTYLLGVNDALKNNTIDALDADFDNRFDVRARFNANLGNVINVDDNFDVYPGLSLGLKNFGGHLGARYFFTDGFGVYTELNAPFAKYKTGTLTPAKTLHNQFTINLGAVFNL